VNRPQRPHRPRLSPPSAAETGFAHAPALWQLLQQTAESLLAVRQGQSTTRVLPRVRAAWRPGVQSLLFQVLRHLGRAQALRSRLAPRAPAPAVDALLCVALALCWDEVSAPYDSHTLVNQAVEAAKRERRTQGQAAFINACLRRFLRERAELLAATDSDPLARTNLPSWWLERLQRDHPEHWSALVDQARQPAPMTLRIQTRRTTREALQARWAAMGLTSQAVGRYGLQLTRPVDVRALPGFLEGECSVQDAAAQLAAPLLWDALLDSPRRHASGPWRLLDACAAPGGKTAHLLEIAPAGDRPVDLLALEIDAARLPRVQENLQRLGLQARVQCADAGVLQQGGEQPWDGILLDAPCTASGIVRRHPDIPWLRRASDVDQLVAQQARLLKALWPQLRPGGILVYCTCSVFRDEGQNQIEAFLAHNTDARLRPSPGHLMPLAPGFPAYVPDNRLGDHDGFYYAVLEKRDR
jgi:16S rRNA (cytosine967-C5)-methyltransferase